MSISQSPTGAASSGQPKPYIRPVIRENAVAVTAADFNGSSWDGSPFRFASKEAPKWLIQALESGQIKVSDVSGSTDYAVWDVDCRGGIVRALPDDQIEHRTDGSLIVHEFPEKHRHPSRLPA